MLAQQTKMRNSQDWQLQRLGLLPNLEVNTCLGLRNFMTSDISESENKCYLATSKRGFVVVSVRQLARATLASQLRTFARFRI